MVDQIEKIIKENERSVVYFYRPSCPYCQYIEPYVTQLQEQYSDAITFTNVDITDNSNLLKEKYDFKTVPTLIYFLHGEPVARHGSRDQSITYEDMQDIIRDVFNV